MLSTAPWCVRRLVARALICATAVPSWLPALHVGVEDRNGDGRPDVWRSTDGAGRIVRVETDIDFDGRPDLEEIYSNGMLVRREIDRNRDGRFDPIQSYTPATPHPPPPLPPLD